jgi:hypothetical protein
MVVDRKVLERELESHFGTECRRLRLLTLKLHVMYQRGWPDRIVVHNGKAYFSELKTLIGKQTTFQLMVSAKLEARGFKVPVLRTKQEITSYLEAIANA